MLFRSVVEIVGGFALLLLFGYAFSWVFALVGLLAIGAGAIAGSTLLGGTANAATAKPASPLLLSRTSPSAGVSNRNKYGTDLIEMDGGKSTGDDCEAFAHHGYNGIETRTVDKIKAWIIAGKGKSGFCFEVAAGAFAQLANHAVFADQLR